MKSGQPEIRIVLQARTDSARLPAKALLPVAGIPCAILAGLRAANRGHSVVLATSDRPVDDLLSATAEKAGLHVFRGRADDVLSRFIAATADLEEQDIVVRLTADNVLPDGSLVEELVSAFIDQDSDYLDIPSIWGKAPYGLSAEVMRVSALRKANRASDSTFDHEHVTAFLRRVQDRREPKSHFSGIEQNIRCTIDDLDDYLRMSRAFSRFSDPVNAPWQIFLEELAQMPDAAPAVSNGPGLVLGTAQLAAPYGSAVEVLPPKTHEAIELVRTAIHYGSVAIDTARAYPGAEAVLQKALAGGWGSRIKVVTKLSPLAELTSDTAPAEAANAAEISVLHSLNLLGHATKPWLLLHRADHIHAWGGAVWSRVKALHADGLLAGLGVSIQSPAEAEFALKDPAVQLIQLPYNLLDWRWRQSGLAASLASCRNLEVHVRSVYLQGILLREPGFWPVICGLDSQLVARVLQKCVKELNRDSVADLCLAYVRAMKWADGVVIGMECINQLENNARLFGQPSLSRDEVDYVDASLPEVPENFLNPAFWSQARVEPVVTTIDGY